MCIRCVLTVCALGGRGQALSRVDAFADGVAVKQVGAGRHPCVYYGCIRYAGEGEGRVATVPPPCP